MSADPENNRWTILLGGDIDPTDRLKTQTCATRVVAADSGMRHAAPLGLKPELWLGDFDSSDGALQTAHFDVPRETHPVAKDQTDGALAVQKALDAGAEHIMLVGAFGGRADQATAHLLMALAQAEAGVPVGLSDGRQEGLVVNKVPLRPNWPNGTLFSLLPFSDLAGVTITGAQWPLDNVAIPLGSTLGLSNVATDGLEIAVQTGRCIAIATLPDVLPRH